MEGTKAVGRVGSVVSICQVGIDRSAAGLAGTRWASTLSDRQLSEDEQPEGTGYTFYRQQRRR